MAKGFEHGYALVIGIGAYKYLRTLRTTRTDAVGVSKVLVERCGYFQEHVWLLEDEAATKTGINKGLRWLAEQTEVDDTVVIFFSGHGVRPIGGIESGEFLCPVNTDPFRLRETALSNHELTTALRGIRASKIAVFLDACHSGGVGEPREANILFKGGLSQEAYDALNGEGKGRVVIASCKPDQVSWELPGIPNGVFTHHLLEGLRGRSGVVRENRVHIFELYDYLSKSVPQTCRDRGVEEQNPLFKGEVEDNFPIALVPTDPATSDWTADEEPQRTLSVTELRDLDYFHELVSLVQQGKAIFVIGPGVSAEVGMPTFAQYRQALERYAAQNQIAVDQGSDFDAVAAAMEKALDRERLGRILRSEALRAQRSLLRQKGQTYTFYTRGAYQLLPVLAKFTRALLTTNWDDLLECALNRNPLNLPTLHTGLHTHQAPPLFQLLGNFNHPAHMLIAKFSIAEMVSSLQTNNTLKRSWQEITDPAADYRFIFLGYEPQQRIIGLLQDALLGPNRPRHDHFFVAPLSPAEETMALVETGMAPIPSTSENLLLALFQALCQFIDREQEQDLIFVDKHQFVEFYGDFGSGKTALLNTAGQRAEAEGWDPEQILRVEWKAEHDTLPRALVAGKERVQPRQLVGLPSFARFLSESEAGLFLIFDAIERLPTDLLGEILAITVPEIIDLNRRGRCSKLLIAGLRPILRWPRDAFRHERLYRHRLPPLEAPEVRDMALSFLLAAEPNPQAQFSPQLIDDIIEVSCGHPGFVKTILTDLTAAQGTHTISLPNHLTVTQKRRYISQFNDEIDCYISWGNDRQVKEVYESRLSVFRKINREILNELQLAEIDVWTSLVSMDLLLEDGSSTNLVIRQMKSVSLRYEDPPGYLAAHRKAWRIFEEGARTLADEVQREYLREILFHVAHVMLVEECDPSRRLKEILAVMKPLAFRLLRDLPSPRLGDKTVVKINQDAELCNLLEACVGSSGLREIQEMFMQKGVVRV